MARLPQPGADDGIWGDVLNEYLRVAHDSEGAIKNGAIDSAALQDNSISGTKLQDGLVTPPKLSSSNTPSAGQVLSYNGSNFEWTASGGAVASVFGRTGVVTASNGDYNATQITNTPSGSITATTVQGAINELDAEKAPIGHTHTAYMTHVFSKAGDLVVGTGTFRLYNDTGQTWTIAAVRASVGTAPSSATIIIDIAINGTTIYATQANRPTIAIGANTALGGTPDTATFVDGQYFTVDIDQVGSSTAGANLTVQITLSRSI